MLDLFSDDCAEVSGVMVAHLVGHRSVGRGLKVELAGWDASCGPAPLRTRMSGPCERCVWTCQLRAECTRDGMRKAACGVPELTSRGHAVGDTKASPIQVDVLGYAWYMSGYSFQAWVCTMSLRTTSSRPRSGRSDAGVLPPQQAEGSPVSPLLIMAWAWQFAVA